jgi:predicted DNA-binding protein (MmcQ/YjbR family)
MPTTRRRRTPEPTETKTTQRAGIAKLRRICLALPGATEKEAWGDPTFRVRDKIFAMHKIGDGRASLWCKAPAGAQEMLVGAAPERFYVPPYVGHKGWIGVRLDGEVNWAEVAHLVETSHEMTAPRKRPTGRPR